MVEPETICLKVAMATTPWPEAVATTAWPEGPATIRLDGGEGHDPV